MRGLLAAGETAGAEEGGGLLERDFQAVEELARGGLTTLGIIIGIVAVVTPMTAANGLQNRFRESFSAVGADVVYVSRMPWVVMNDFFRYRNRPPIDLREARLLALRPQLGLQLP